MKKTFWMISIIAILVVALASAGFFFVQNRQLNQTQIDEAKELAEVVKQVSQLMDVPSEETPVLATVTDKEKVNSQPFFARSENGDKVLLYTQFGRAILYRPSTERIIDVTVINTTETTTPIDTIETSTESTVIPEPSPTKAVVAQTSVSPTKVLLINGTLTTGLANATEQRLAPVVDNLEISTRNAVQQDYATTRVIVINSNTADKAAEIASFFNVAVSSQIPEDETVVDADILVILGEDAR